MAQVILVLLQENEISSMNIKYSIGNEVIYSTEVLKVNFCDFYYVYIPVKCNITVVAAATTQK